MVHMPDLLEDRSRTSSSVTVVVIHEGTAGAGVPSIRVLHEILPFPQRMSEHFAFINRFVRKLASSHYRPETMEGYVQLGLNIDHDLA